jgi:tetratricopeptide (TPR) repeat protein
LERLLKLSLVFIFFVISCQSTQQLTKTKIDETKYAASDSLKKNTVIQKVDDVGYQKVISYPYLTIKFQQQDTEVEMVIDPLETNLQLDLKRQPGSTIEISPDSYNKADSTKIKPSKQEPIIDLLAEDFSTNDNDLTDEILADLTKAQSYFYHGEYREALKILQKSIEKKPTASAYAIGGSIYYVNGEVKKAIQAWETALKLNPDMAEIKEMLATLK